MKTESSRMTRALLAKLEELPERDREAIITHLPKTESKSAENPLLQSTSPT